MNEIENWKRLTDSLSKMMVEGIGLKCPFCGEKSIRSMGSGILQLSCYTRIKMRPESGGMNVVTFNGHEIGIHSTPEKRYPYKEFDCKA